MFIFAVYDYVFDYIIVFIEIYNQIIVEEFINIGIVYICDKLIDRSFATNVDSYIFRDRVCNRVHINTCKICIMVRSCAIDDTWFGALIETFEPTKHLVN